LGILGKGTRASGSDNSVGPGNLGTEYEYLNFLKYIQVSHLHTGTSVQEYRVKVLGHRVPAIRVVLEISAPKMNTQTS
jgi:hypothetical protein